jgi:NAD(P)H-dependent FMN reductase
MVKLVTVLGSVTPPGRSLKAMQWMVAAAREEQPDLEAKLLNLADYKISFADGRAPEKFGDDTASVVAEIRTADAVIFASPVYRASFTGALKNLLDQLPVEALMGKPCGIVAIGASQHHYLGVDWHLRDVLTWFGALVAPVSVYLSPADFTDGQPGASAREDLRALAQTVLKLGAGAKAVGPIPLAARRS